MVRSTPGELVSRSIHTTVHQYAEVGRWQYADELDQATQRQKLLQELRKKRRIGRQVRQERRLEGAERWPVSTDTIPIHVHEAGPYVHFAAGPEDLRAVMRRLPGGVLEGLDRIELRLGSEEQLDRSGRPQQSDLVPDPFVGRYGRDLGSGVYGGYVLGHFRPRTMRLAVFGYVYDPGLPDREFLEFSLRLRMLRTFVHEVAHHDDEMRRTGRGRWLADDETKAECYAEAQRHKWYEACVVPYFRDTYGPYIREKYASRFSATE